MGVGRKMFSMEGRLCIESQRERKWEERGARRPEGRVGWRQVGNGAGEANGSLSPWRLLHDAKELELLYQDDRELWAAGKQG